MSTRRRGISDHEVLYTFETACQRFRRLGMPEHVAQRHALYCAFRLSGAFDSAQAREATDEILGTPPTPGEVTSPVNDLSRNENHLS
jgi:hypothetical protein